MGVDAGRSDACGRAARSTRAGAVRVAALLGIGLLVACASAGPDLERPVERASPAATRSLLALAQAAIDRGELPEAAARLERAVAAAPRSVEARVALAHVARLRGDRATAVRHLDAALALDPGDPTAIAARASLWAEDGERERALRSLGRAVAERPSAEVHQALFELTGLEASSRPSPGLDDALERLSAHPYDPAAHLRVAEHALAEGRPELAEGRLRDALWLGDLRPAAARRAFRLWRDLDPARAGQRLVGVAVFADEGVRRDPAWRMRVRMLWGNSTRTLEPVLRTTFVPVALGAFDASTADSALPAIEAAFLDTAPPLPTDGIVALLTTRPVPSRPGAKLGLAQLLGRRLIARVEPRAEESRTLLHEILHLYGAVHVAPAEPSLLNPSGSSLALDAANQAILELTRERRFSAGGADFNVFPFVDEEALAVAWVRWIELNLGLRAQGLDRAREEAEISRYSGARLARGALALDDHMADVSAMVARILLRNRRFSEAHHFFDLAARLYGRGSVPGREAAEWASRALETGSRIYGIEPR